MFCMHMFGFSGNLHTLRKLLGGLFHALRLCRPHSCICLVAWVCNLYVLEDQQEVLYPFWVTLLEQVVLVPLQWAHAQDVACKLQICGGVDLLSVRTHGGAVKQTREILGVVVKLQHALHKLTNTLSGFLRRLRY